MDIEYERHNDSDIFFVKSRLGHFFHMHRHSQSELIYVKKGALNCVVGAEKYCVSKGCLMIIPKNHIHEYLESDDTEYSILLVSLPHIEQYTLSSAVITRDTDIINLFISMTQEAENRYEYYTDAVKHMAGYLNRYKAGIAKSL